MRKSLYLLRLASLPFRLLIQYRIQRLRLVRGTTTIRLRPLGDGSSVSEAEAIAFAEVHLPAVAELLQADAPRVASKTEGRWDCVLAAVAILAYRAAGRKEPIKSPVAWVVRCARLRPAWDFRRIDQGPTIHRDAPGGVRDPPATCGQTGRAGAGRRQRPTLKPLRAGGPGPRARYLTWPRSAAMPWRWPGCLSTRKTTRLREPSDWPGAGR